MSRNMNRGAIEKTRKTRRRNAILWSLGAIAVIVILLSFEQVALLYLIATLGVAVLLIIVAFADLHGEPRESAQAGTIAATPAIAVTPATTPAATTFGSTRPRSSVKRRRR